MKVHETASAGFERGADEYERARPSYPDAAVRDIAEALQLRPGTVVADVAAGTGKLTRLVIASGATVIAVEPVSGMRALLPTTAPAARPIGAVAEALPFPDASLDAMTIAQAFHWFDAAAALDEIARVLRPAAGLALVWNERDRSVKWQDDLKQLMSSIAGPLMPRYRSGDGVWEAALAADDRFTPVECRRYPNQIEMDRQTFGARIGSTSYVSVLDDRRRADVVEAALELAPDGQTIVESYVTEVHLCVRTN